MANLVLNPSFENRTGNNFDNWTESGTITAYTADYYDGLTSCRIQGTPTWIISDFITIDNIKSYLYTFYMKYLVSSSMLTIIVEYDEFDTTLANIFLPNPQPGSSWGKYSQFFSYDLFYPGCVKIKIKIGNATDTLVDLVSFEEAAKKIASDSLLTQDNLLSPGKLTASDSIILTESLRDPTGATYTNVNYDEKNQRLILADRVIEGEFITSITQTNKPIKAISLSGNFGSTGQLVKNSDFNQSDPTDVITDWDLSNLNYITREEGSPSPLVRLNTTNLYQNFKEGS